MEEQQDNEQAPQRPQIENSLHGGMIRDVSDSVMPQGAYYHARNAAVNLPDGQSGLGLSTEPANVFETVVPYTLIGAIQLHGDQWWLFSTDNTHSEIGLYIENTGTYSTQLNDVATLLAGLPGLGFNTSHLITGAARRNFDCGFDVYWSDGALNPDRMCDTQFLYPNPFVQNCVTVSGCTTCTNTNLIDIEQIRLEPQFSVPCLKLSKSLGSGTLLNGSYLVVVRYAINGIGCTSYMPQSNIASIFRHNDEAGAIVLNISGISTETTILFPEIEVVVISQINAQVLARRLGIYSSTQQTIYIDNLSFELPVIDLKTIPVSIPIIDASDAIYSIANYLTRVGVREKPEFNYQPLANNIRAWWTCYEYPGDYYRLGGMGFPMNVSYLRGEVYEYYIRFRYTTGDVSASYHIPGLPAGTAPTLIIGAPGLGDNSTPIAHGRFGGYSSTEIYPNNEPSIWGALCGQPIRHHRFPDQSTFYPSNILSHYTSSGNIRIMGVFFDNIAAPVDINGNVIPNIQGYEILRATRDGNESIIACGMINHMRGYQNADGSVGMYQNYPYDDLHADRYLTTSQTIGVVGGVVDGWQGNEQVIVMKNIVSFHSPDTVFSHPVLGGAGTLTLTNILTGYAQGSFDEPYRHPMFKLLTDRASALGILISTSLTALMLAQALSGGSVNLDFASTDGLPMTTPLTIRAFPDGSLGTWGDSSAIAEIAMASLALTLLLPIQLKVLQQQYMNVVNGLVPASQYARQYNSHGYYSTPYPSTAIPLPVTDYEYIKGHIQEFAGMTVNNLYRNDYVAMEVESGIPNLPPYFTDPIPQAPGGGSLTGQNYNTAVVWSGYGALPPNYVDCSRFTLAQGPSSPYPAGPRASLGPFTSPIVSWYGRYSVNRPSQYGQIDSTKQVPIGCMQPIIPQPLVTYTSQVLFGGDIYITRYTEKNPFLYFNDWLVDATEDYQYDYTGYENVPYPRYWVNNSKVYYDFWDRASKNWHLDELPSPGLTDFWIKGGGYFYLFNNGVRDFWVESTVNVGYRDWEDIDSRRFYDPYGYTDVYKLFRSDIIKSDPFYKYDYSLSSSRFWSNYVSWGKCLDRDYNPVLAYTCYNYYPRRVAYSLPQEEEIKKDNWKVFLPNDYKDFPTRVVSIRNISKTGAIFLLDDQAPMILQGIETIGSKNSTDYTIGTGLLFGQNLQQITNVDDSYQYGSCQNRMAVISTPYGVIWCSQEQGKIFHYAPNKTYYNQGESMVDIATHGLKYDLSRYMPSLLLQQFPDYPLFDNPVAGVGMQLIYDNITEVLYICKKDYVLKKEWSAASDNASTTLGYVTLIDGQFYLVETYSKFPVRVGDPLYFEDASWTLSYDMKGKKFISFHDWHPSYNIQTKDHFLTTTDNRLWRHNKTTGLFCNYYGIDYPFEVEYPLNTGNKVVTIQSLEVYMESYLYNINRTDKFHQYDGFFDYCLIRNSEQATQPLLMQLKPWDDPYGSLNFPFNSAAGINVYYTKQEQRYRVGMSLFDSTDDRGEFDLATNILIQTNPNWYTWNLNNSYYDPNKPPLQRKKIRHFKSRVFLRRYVPGTRSMTWYFGNTNMTLSKR